MRRRFNIGDKVHIVGQNDIMSEGLIVDVKRILFVKLYAVRYIYAPPYSKHNCERHDWFLAGQLARCELKSYGRK